MTNALSVRPDDTFADIRFTRSASGHVQSAWWSYNWRFYNPDGPYVGGSHFHMLRQRSIDAFCAALGVKERDVLVSVRTNPIDGEIEWRCGTAKPVQLPVPKIEQPKIVAIKSPVIDV